MKRSLYNMALAICTAAAMYSCSLDEYNPSDTSGEGELKTVEGLKNLGTYCKGGKTKCDKLSYST